MSNNEIMQFSYFYWKSNEKKADEKMTLFHDASGKCIKGYYSIVVWFVDVRAYFIRLFLFTCFSSVSLCEQIRGV